ncbi:MAG TPA: tetratricopeptide repeat protein [Acidobacteriota bacterium]|nr:tetratricopeptide repeat protein [Acidobacteriota bacterium]
MRLIVLLILMAGPLLVSLQPRQEAAPQASGNQEQPQEERLWQHRNLGKAYYENTVTQPKAIEEFRKALDLAPDSPRERVNYALALLRNGKTEEAVPLLNSIQEDHPDVPHTWFNLGVFYKREGEFEKALRQFEGHRRLAPEIAVTHYNLGLLYRLEGRLEEALESFQQAARLDHMLAAPHFQLSNLYRAAGDREKAEEEMEIFRRLKEAQKDAPIPEDLEWSIHAEIYDPVDSVPRAAPQSAGWRVSQVDSLGAAEDSSGGGIRRIMGAEGESMLMVWFSDTFRLYRHGLQPIQTPGLDVRGPLLDVAVGDVDDDGAQDLALVEADKVRLFLNRPQGFEEVEEALAEGDYERALWLDFDHDYDLDLFLFGRQSSLLRNQGQEGFVDRSDLFPFKSGRVTAAAFHDHVKDWEGMDLVVSYQDGPSMLYLDQLGGKYLARELEALPAATRRLLSFDVDNDGHSDLLAGGEQGLHLLRRTSDGYARSLLDSSQGPFLLADPSNRGWPDLFLGSAWRRNLGQGRFGPPMDLPLSEAVAWWGGGLPEAVPPSSAPALLALTEEGQLMRLEDGKAGGQWISVLLRGERNLRTAHHGEVEVKAGSLYQKRIYRGRPLHFGLGDQPRVDTVRITWPNGLIQNEPLPEPGQRHAYREAKQLSGSCPMVFTWDGQRFRFINDILGVAPLGASAGDGVYFQADHDEYIQIPGEALVERGGRLEIRLTEELREVAYLDQLRLMAVDHPSRLDIYTSDRFKSPPFPEFRLYGVEKPIRPRAATDGSGNDLLPLLSVRDTRAVTPGTGDSSSRLADRGVLPEHVLELDFGPQPELDRALLVLHGWLDWADASTFVHSDQAGISAAPPRLERLGADGEWRLLVEDLGAPAGKWKTIAVPLELPSGQGEGNESLRLRIVTSWAVHWDEVFLSREVEEPPAILHEIPLAQAVLDYRGFSKPIVDPQRRQPDAFDYQQWRPWTRFNQARGHYTRLGRVDQLLGRIDDRFVIMGAGDELRLSFDAGALPEPPAGHSRQYLLFADGWVKDGDLNTAHGTTVEPLPFHGMSGYPYGPEERYPDTPQHRRYRREYQTRPALRQFHPLAPLSRSGTTLVNFLGAPTNFQRGISPLGNVNYLRKGWIVGSELASQPSQKISVGGLADDRRESGGEVPFHPSGPLSAGSHASLQQRETHD